MANAFKKFRKKLERILEGAGFPHPETEEFVPYINRITSKGHLKINTPLDDLGNPYPGLNGRAFVMTPGTSASARAVSNTISRMLRQGVPEDYCMGMMLHQTDDIVWSEEEYDFSSLPAPGSLVKAYPTPYYENELSKPGNEAINKLSPFLSGKFPLLVGGWRYAVDGRLFVEVVLSGSNTSGTIVGPRWIDADPREWIFEKLS